MQTSSLKTVEDNTTDSGDVKNTRLDRCCLSNELCKSKASFRNDGKWKEPRDHH